MTEGEDVLISIFPDAATCDLNIRELDEAELVVLFYRCVIL